MLGKIASMQVSELIGVEIPKAFRCEAVSLVSELEKRLQDRGLASKLAIRDALGNIKQAFHRVSSTATANANASSAGQYDACVGHLKDLLWKELCPLNVFEMQSLIQAALDKVETLSSIEEIVLLFGKSHAGKSTTILYCAGCDFVETTVDGIPHYDIDPNNSYFQSNPVLQSVKTSPYMKSETRFVNPVTFDAQPFVGSRRSTMLTLCDAAGK
jgi:hypothetical protein